jgi:hypothetical protein
VNIHEIHGASTMHEIRVRAAVVLVHRAMEFWGRSEPVPERLKAIKAWLDRRDRAAITDASAHIAQEIR